MKYLLIALALFYAENTFSQSKKKQIEMLQHQLDSANLVNVELEERYRSKASDLEKLAAETKLLRKIMIGYVHQIDTLNQMNLKLEQELEESRNLRIKSTKSDLYEVAHVDYHVSRLQRIFVVISEENVDQILTIKAIVCELKENYPLDDKSNISFFTEKKYANYKSVIFETGGNDASEEVLQEYQDWKDNFYLGEFEFETRIYTTFPSTDIPVKKNFFLLGNCN